MMATFSKSAAWLSSRNICLISVGRSKSQKDVPSTSLAIFGQHSFPVCLDAASRRIRSGGRQRSVRQCHPALPSSTRRRRWLQSSGRTNAIKTAVPATPIIDPSTQATIGLKRTPEGSLTLSVERESPPLSIARDLTYYIGSGRVGRSFLFNQEGGFLYQSPVSYYADGDTFRASPGFQRKNTVDLTRPVQPSCLLCHASRLQPVAGTQNRYDAKQPFLEGGVSCERCHGPGQRHVAAMKSNARGPANHATVNPAKLAPAERDSVCAQCHLTGAARVARASSSGRSSYTPGDDLARTVAVFVWRGSRDTGVTVTSHFENLEASRCKQISGDRLWCGTCHSPHGAPVDVRGAAWHVIRRVHPAHLTRRSAALAIATGARVAICRSPKFATQSTPCTRTIRFHVAAGSPPLLLSSLTWSRNWCHSGGELARILATSL